jgi:carboxymethylenebutenolidase
MCDEFIHQGLTHDPTVSRRTFVVGTAATLALSSAAAVAQAKVVEKDVNVPMASGVADSALFYPEGKGPWPAVLVWTDILGLRPVFREMGRRLAAEGYLVLVPNPFYRSAKAPVVDGSFDFSKPEDRAKLMPMAAALKRMPMSAMRSPMSPFWTSNRRPTRRKRWACRGTAWAAL